MDISRFGGSTARSDIYSETNSDLQRSHLTDTALSARGPVAGNEAIPTRPARPWRKRAILVSSVDPTRAARAKRAFTTRRVPQEDLLTLVSGPLRPRSGDLVLAEVTRLGNHRRLEMTNGRRSNLYLGDEVVVAYGNRYATDQFESYVPADLGRTHLVASGGVASTVASKSADVRTATDIKPLGLLGDARGRPINLSTYGIAPIEQPESRPPTLAVVGTSMNSGKTTTINRLVVGLRDAGHLPGVTKVTGTGSGGDFWVMLDAGAHAMLDFTDAGLPSTFGTDLAVLEATTSRLIDHLVGSGCGSILVEVADGLLQHETSHLLRSQSFRERIDGVIFAAGDAMGALGGLATIEAMGIPVVAIAGRLTRSGLAVSEVRAERGDIPIMTLANLSDPEMASSLLGLPFQSPSGDVDSDRHMDGAMVVDLRANEQHVGVARDSRDQRSGSA